MTETWRSDGTKREVASVVHAFFEAGKDKELASLARFHSPANLFTKFDDVPPYTREGSDEAFVFEQASFANVSDHSYKLDDLRIDLVEGVAVATFYHDYSCMFVNDHSFEGRTVASRSRVTMLFARFDGSWKIVHEHFSSVPDWQEIPRQGNKEGETL
jgi:ketosteroid isomerase-like protein